MRFSIYRYDPDSGAPPRLQAYDLPAADPGMTLLHALLALKEQDETLAFRRSCGEGVCGSDGMNVNGRNRLACITLLADLKEPVVIRPLPGLPVIRDLIVDMSPFYRQYHRIRPWLMTTTPRPERERLQTPDDRDRLDGLYECILCGCCSAACPAFWWNPDRFLGPAALLQAARFVFDSRDEATEQRLDELAGPDRLFRCRTILNCMEACPKGLSPARAIIRLRQKMLERAV